MTMTNEERINKLETGLVYIDDAEQEIGAVVDDLRNDPDVPPALPVPLAIFHPLGPGAHYVTQEFGVNTSKYGSIGGHDGMDFRAAIGTPIFAAHEGKVVVAGYRPDHPTYDAYGDQVRIELIALDEDGLPRVFESNVAHLSRLDVVVGQYVERGQQVGLSGGGLNDSRSGNTTGPHLHYGEIERGSYGRRKTFLKYDFMNPRLWLPPVGDVVFDVIERRKMNPGKKVYVRAYPDTSSKIRTVLQNEEEFEVFGVSSNGRLAIDPSRTGWTSSWNGYSTVIE